MRQKSAETTKKVVWFCLANGVAWVWCSYLLAYLGRADIAENLSKVALTEIVAVVDVDHAGTLDDPIPAAIGMDYIYGKYYRDPEDGKTYLCEREGEEPGNKIILQYLPHELIDQYFTDTTKPEPEPEPEEPTKI